MNIKPGISVKNRSKLKFIVVIYLICILITGCISYKKVINHDAAYNPAWSPTEDKIAFECIYLTLADYLDGFMNDGIYKYPLRDICIWDISSQEIVRVTNSRLMFSPAWSSNGVSLAWMSHNITGDIENNLAIDQNLTVWNTELDTYLHFPAPENFKYDEWSGDHLQWIKDDTQIILQGRGVVLDLETGLYTYFSDEIDGKPIGFYSLSPDGNYLAITQLEIKDDLESHYDFQIFENDTLISDSQTAATNYNPPAWIANSFLVAWVGTSSGSSFYGDTLLISNALTGETVSLSIPDVDEINHPVWIANETQVIFASFPDELHFIDLEIVTEPFDVNIVNHVVKNVPRLERQNPLSVSPDGQKAVFVTYENKLEIVNFFE